MTAHVVLDNIADHPETVSLKRLAWAFGCARRGSDVERLLEQALRDRIATEQRKEPP